MCRMFGFSAARPAAVQRSLLDEPNALRIQSQEHPDGWGIGYYPEGAAHPSVLRSLNCAFADAEFAESAAHVSARTVIAHVRKASCGPIALDNTHPFHHEHWLFAHNGTVSQFEAVRAQLEAEIDADLRGLLRGQTDSERLFYLVLTRLRARRALDQAFAVDELGREVLAVAALVHGLADAGAAGPSSLTLLLRDGRGLGASRDGGSLHASLVAPAPLARGAAGDELMVASEILSAERAWTEVPERGVIGLERAERLYRWDP